MTKKSRSAASKILYAGQLAKALTATNDPVKALSDVSRIVKSNRDDAFLRDPNFHYKFTHKTALGAIEWFKSKILELNPGIKFDKTEYIKTPEASKVSDKVIEQKDLKQKEISDDESVNLNTFQPGSMYLYHYDPKHRTTLPYYDTYPLIILTGISGNKFSGINLHYLPPQHRMILLSNLAPETSIIDKNGKFAGVYVNNENLQNVQEFGLYKPCFKHYLKTNIRSVIKYIPPEDWGFAAALPLETFIKQPRHVVWADSLATNQMTL